MFLCYIDESGTPEIPGNSSHYVLAGLSIPVANWKDCDKEISTIKAKYFLSEAEIHTSWILRPYLEQSKIHNFHLLDKDRRIYEVDKLRNINLLKLQKSPNRKLYKQTKKNYRHTHAYIHLTYDERKDFIKDISMCISKWDFARLFAECIDKIFFDNKRTQTNSIESQAIEQVVTRFEAFLKLMCVGSGSQCYGLLIHDNNETVAKKHTALMQNFHRNGTLWTKITQIIETPLFVDSQLTSLVQIADLCSYSLRRYLENDDRTLFDLIFKRADRKGRVVVGVRHFTTRDCNCKICSAHRRR
jgi:hypothetical protein